MARSRFSFFLSIIGTLSSTVFGQVCTNVDIHCFYDRQRPDENKTVYCLQAGSSERQSQLSPTEIRDLSCPLSLEMLAIVSGGGSGDTGIINATCTAPGRSIFAVMNVAQIKVICDETGITKKISGPSEALKILRLNSSLTTPCDCIKRAAAAWSLRAFHPSEYEYKCGVVGHKDVVAASGTNVTTKLCIQNDRNPCLPRIIWKVEVYWTSDDDIDLFIGMPSDKQESDSICDNRNGLALKFCLGTRSSITNGRWTVILGPDDKSGNDGGYEYATIIASGGPPSGSVFSVFVVSQSGSRFNVHVTVKYFLNSAEIASFVPNIESPNTAGRNAWGSLLGIDILALTFAADPNTFHDIRLQPIS